MPAKKDEITTILRESLSVASCWARNQQNTPDDGTCNLYAISLYTNIRPSMLKQVMESFPIFRLYRVGPGSYRVLVKTMGQANRRTAMVEAAQKALQSYESRFEELGVKFKAYMYYQMD